MGKVKKRGLRELRGLSGVSSGSEGKRKPLEEELRETAIVTKQKLRVKSKLKQKQKERNGREGNGRERNGKEGKDEKVGREKRDESYGSDEEEEEREGGESRFIEARLTKKILGSARKQQLEEEREEEEDQMEDETYPKTKADEEEEEGGEVFSEGDQEEILEIDQELEQITEEEERALSMFMSADSGFKKQTLADIIMEKLDQFKAQQQEKSNPNQLGLSEQAEERVKQKIDPKVFNVYKGVGKLLSRYTAGKIPKAFKVIPSLSNWEEILFLTSPETWSPHATRQATKIFTSNLSTKLAQRYFNFVLLPRVREEIRLHKKLNFHLYLALKKALFKPSAFYKGIVLPLCEAGDCTLREATIIGSVLSKVSVPVLHSSAAILKIAEMKYSGANSLFLKVLLNKKYALPYRVIDALISHFTSFIQDSRTMPVLWYQSLLTFVQRYKTDLLPAQKDALKVLIRHHTHYYFSEEILRELSGSTSRGEKQSSELPLEEQMELDGLEE